MANIVPVTISDALFYKTDPVFQYNEGDQLLVIDGITLPASYRVDFSNHIDNYMAYTVTGDASGAVIPPEILANGNTIYAFYVDEAGDTVTTQYRIEIPVIRRPMPEDYVPSPSSHGIINQLTQDVGDIKSDLGDLDDLETTDKSSIVAAINEARQSGGGSGLTENIKTALLQIASKVAYIDDDGQAYYQDLYDALYPPVGVTSITAVYTQSGTVYDTDSLDSLKADLVVTAYYEDSASAVVTSYTLNGTLTVGTSTITVSYGGKTTNFTVTVTEAAPYTFYDYLQGDGVAFLDTGLSAKTYLADSYKKYVKFRLGTIQNEKCVLGARNAWGTTGVLVQINTATADRMNVCFGNVWTKDTTPVANDLIELELDHPTIKKNGETLGTVSNASTTITSETATIPLFGYWGGSSGGSSYAYNNGYIMQFFPYKIYRFTVTEKSTGTVVADMKPAMRISDSAVGMYDSVRDEFYTNARNTGVFTLGNDGA